MTIIYCGNCDQDICICNEICGICQKKRKPEDAEFQSIDGVYWCNHCDEYYGCSACAAEDCRFGLVLDCHVDDVTCSRFDSKNPECADWEGVEDVCANCNELITFYDEHFCREDCTEDNPCTTDKQPCRRCCAFGLEIITEILNCDNLPSSPTPEEIGERVL